MKSQVYDRFGGGLLLLVMLTIAVIASEAQPNFAEPAPAKDGFELDAGFRITIDQGRLAELEALSSVVETVLDLPIRIDVSVEETETPLPDTADSGYLLVQ